MNRNVSLQEINSPPKPTGDSSPSQATVIRHSKPSSPEPTAVSVEQMVRRVVKSGLIPLRRVRSLWDRLPHDRKPQNGLELGQEFVRQGLLTPYQLAVVIRGKESSLILGKYTVLDQIGQGGVGTVLKARHRVLNRAVALKRLSPEGVHCPGSLQRFKREMVVGAKLDHPNIVAVYDADEAHDVPFLVMQYVEGRDLASLVRQQGPLPLATAIDYVLQAARGLEHAHAEGIIHRDIKPSNLLLDRWGTVKVVDFGLARIANVKEVDARGRDLTCTGTIMGTADYMPPEQALNTKDADHRADIYSLGAVLYFLLTGQPLYGGKTVVEKFLAHRDAPIPSLQHICLEASSAIDTIFAKMVAKKLEDRWQSMAAVIAALENYLGIVPRVPDGLLLPPIPNSIPTACEDDQLNDFFQKLGGKGEAGATVTLQSDAAKHLAIFVDPNAETKLSRNERPRFASRTPRSSYGRSRASTNSPLWNLVEAIRWW